jgi:hypothetical protein
MTRNEIKERIKQEARKHRKCELIHIDEEGCHLYLCESRKPIKIKTKKRVIQLDFNLEEKLKRISKPVVQFQYKRRRNFV